MGVRGAPFALAGFAALAGFGAGFAALAGFGAGFAALAGLLAFARFAGFAFAIFAAGLDRFTALAISIAKRTESPAFDKESAGRSRPARSSRFFAILHLRLRVGGRS